MGRKQIVLSRKIMADIEARTARGESAKTIHFAVPAAPSLRTIERIQQAQRVSVRPVDAPPQSTEAVESVTRAARLANELGRIIDQIISRAVDEALAAIPACPTCKLPTMPGSSPCRAARQS